MKFFKTRDVFPLVSSIASPGQYRGAATAWRFRSSARFGARRPGNSLPAGAVFRCELGNYRTEASAVPPRQKGVGEIRRDFLGAAQPIVDSRREPRVDREPGGPSVSFGLRR